MASQDIYGMNGGVPQQQPLNGSGGQALSVRSNPNDFGAAIGQGIEAIGKQGEQLADHYGGMMLETAANTAEAAHVKEVSDLEANYRQKEGSAAVAARPQFEQAILDSTQKYREQLPFAAAHMFDANVTHFNAIKMGGAADYAAGQAKSANLNSQTALMDIATTHAGDLSVVTDDKAFGSLVLAPIIHGGNAIADIHGITGQANGINQQTGNYSYPDTPEGKAAEAQHLMVTNAKLASAYNTAAKTVADNQGASASAAWVQKHWDSIPDAAKAQLNQFLAPKIRQQEISGNVEGVLSGIYQDYNNKALGIQNPLDVIRKNEGIGYSKDNKGEVVNGINSLAFPKEFSEAKQILDTQGQAAATKYADNFYQKQIIDKNGIDKLPAATQAIVADGIVNHGAGDFGQSLVTAAKNGASPQQLIDMRRVEYQRLNDTGKPEYVKSFAGWNSRLDSLQAGINQQTTGAPQEYQSRTDYLKSQQEVGADKVYNDYMANRPDDIHGAEAARSQFIRRTNQDIHLEEKRVSGMVDTVSTLAAKPAPDGRVPTTIQEIGLFNPQAKSMTDEIEQQHPKIAKALTKQMSEAVNPSAPRGYGAGFLPILNRIVGNTDDPDTIKDAKDLASAYGDKSDLYKSGYAKAQDLLKMNSTPDGQASLVKQTQFLTNLRGQMEAGVAGDKRFEANINGFFAAYKENPNDATDMKGKFVKSLNLPSKAEVTSSRISHSLDFLNSVHFFTGENK